MARYSANLNTKGYKKNPAWLLETGWEDNICTVRNK